MRFIRYNREADLSALVRRAYRLERSADPDVVRRAEAALLRANPHLSDLRVLPRDSVIVVPQLQGLQTAERTLSGGEAAEALLAEVTRATESLGEALETAAGAVLAEAEATQKLAKSQEFLKAVKTTGSDALELAARTVETAAKRVEESKLRLQQQKAMMEQVRRDLAELGKRFG